MITFYILGQKFVKFFVGILENLRLSERHSEINWPLVILGTNSPLCNWWWVASFYKKILPLDWNTRPLNNEMTGLPKDKPGSSLIFLFYVVCEFIPKDDKNEQKPGANSSGGAHLVIGDGLRHFLLCSIIASDSIAYMRHLVQGRRNICPANFCRKWIFL